MVEPNKLPTGWKWTTLDQIAEIRMGQSPPSKTYNKNGKGLPFYQGKTDFGEVYPTHRVWCSEPKLIADRNDILISVRAPVGPTNLAKEKCSIGRGLGVISSLHDISPFMILHYLRLKEKDIADMGTGSTFTAINRANLESIAFPLPPKNEQNRIVSKIEQLFAESKSARVSLEKVSQTIKQLRQATLAAAFKGELVPATSHERIDELVGKITRERKSKWEQEIAGGRKTRYEEPREYFEDDLPPIPNHWKYVSLESVCYNVQNGATPLRSNPTNFDANGIPLIKVENIMKNGKVVLNEDQLRIHRSVHEKQSRSKVKPNDVLVNIVGPPLGKVGIVSSEIKEANINQAIVLMRTVPSYRPKTLLYCLLSPFYYNLMVNMSKGVRQSNIRKSDIGRIPIPLLPIDEQDRLIAKIEEMISLIDRLEYSYIEAKKRVNKVDQSILAKAFRGELVPQDPNDEPASILLEKIRKYGKR